MRRFLEGRFAAIRKPTWAAMLPRRAGADGSALIYLVPLVLLGLFVAFVIWMIQRLGQPSLPVARA